MIVLLLFLYPRLAGSQLVGTFLVQAVPLTMAAALGALLFGHVKFGVTTSLVIGGVPAVIVGSFLSSRAPDRYLQPLITVVIFASGLKYIGLGTTALVLVLAAVLAAAGAYWLIRVRPVHDRGPAPAHAAEAGPGLVEAGPNPAEAGLGLLSEAGPGAEAGLGLAGAGPGLAAEAGPQVAAEPAS
jgi:hypothetical protein